MTAARTTRTIFLATTGRYVTLGRGECAMPAETLAQIRQQGLAGWLVFVSGDIYATPAPKLARTSTIEGATEAQWGAAVAAFHRIRRGLPPAA